MEVTFRQQFKQRRSVVLDFIVYTNQTFQIRRVFFSDRIRIHRLHQAQFCLNIYIFYESTTRLLRQLVGLPVAAEAFTLACRMNTAVQFVRVQTF